MFGFREFAARCAWQPQVDHLWRLIGAPQPQRIFQLIDVASHVCYGVAQEENAPSGPEELRELGVDRGGQATVKNDGHQPIFAYAAATVEHGAKSWLDGHWLLTSFNAKNKRMLARNFVWSEIHVDHQPTVLVLCF